MSRYIFCVCIFTIFSSQDLRIDICRNATLTMRWFLWWDVLWTEKSGFPLKNKPLGIGPHVSWRSYHLPSEVTSDGEMWTFEKGPTPRWRVGSSSSRQQCLSWAQDTCGHSLSLLTQLSCVRLRSRLPHLAQRGSQPRVSCLGSHPSTSFSFFLLSPYHWDSSLLEESWGEVFIIFLGCMLRAYLVCWYSKESLWNSAQPQVSQTHAIPCRGSSQPRKHPPCVPTCPQVKNSGVCAWGLCPVDLTADTASGVQEGFGATSDPKRKDAWTCQDLISMNAVAFTIRKYRFPVEPSFHLLACLQDFMSVCFGVLMTLFSMRNSYTWRLTSICTLNQITQAFVWVHNTCFHHLSRKCVQMFFEQLLDI